MYSKFAKLLQENSETAYQVAKLTQISTSTLSDWKSGRSKPKVDKLRKIAEHFDVPVTYFLENSEKGD